MAQDEMILVAIEEMAKQLVEVKKTIGQSNTINEIDLSPLNSSIAKIDERFNILSGSLLSYRGELSQLNNTLRLFEADFQRERQSIAHTYIEIKKPYWWIIGFVSFVLISFSICFYFFQNNKQLRSEVDFHKSNDLKYRFIKLRSDNIADIIKFAKTTNEYIYLIDGYYRKNTKEVERFVYTKEDAIKQEFEASELAKQKRAEALKAEEEAKQLKNRLDGVRIN